MNRILFVITIILLFASGVLLFKYLNLNKTNNKSQSIQTNPSSETSPPPSLIPTITVVSCSNQAYTDIPQEYFVKNITIPSSHPGSSSIRNEIVDDVIPLTRLADIYIRFLVDDAKCKGNALWGRIVVDKNVKNPQTNIFINNESNQLSEEEIISQIKSGRLIQKGDVVTTFFTKTPVNEKNNPFHILLLEKIIIQKV
jgi:hypothetical protein